MGWWYKPEGEGRKVEVPVPLCHVSERAQELCFVTMGWLRGTAGGGWEAGARGSGGWGETHRSPPGKEEVLFLLSMAHSSLSALEGCSAFGGGCSHRLGLAFLLLGAFHD